MIEVDKITCCDAEFALCHTLMRSKHKLPGLLYSALRPAITRVTNVDNTIFFKFAELKSYRNEKKRPYAKYVKEPRPYYYVEDDYIYIPDFHIELINVEVLYDPQEEGAPSYVLRSGRQAMRIRMGLRIHLPD